MKRIGKLAVLILLAVLVGMETGRVVTHAQTTAVLQFSGSWSTHAACVPTPAQTSVCLASDGLWQSINGAAFTQVGGAPTGVTSIAVCNAAGTSCGTPQTGAATVNVPKVATISASTVTLQ